MKIFNSFFALILLCIFISCGKGDEDDFKIKVVKDGTEFTSNLVSGVLTYDEFSGRTFSRLDLSVTIENGIFGLTVVNYDWQNPPKDGVLRKKYDTNANVDLGPNTKCLIIGNVGYCDYGLGSYFFLNGSGFTSFDMNSEENGVIEITANDPDKKTVSGNFDFDVVDFSGNKISFSGDFNNVKYVVQ